ncbi:CIA30 family protein [Psychroserpens algicola]|uniref:CIA30 family protein n=1 Tax=Psychroserpens algicola TaxID=1719034 RepID=UPI001F33794B|nr:CIA30 family protein [Psychroserpens algicola]
MRASVFILLLLTMNTFTLFDFTTSSSTEDWRIIDDVVMGGRSNGSFEISKEGHGTFSGYVSLENNGGFSSLRYNFKTKDVSSYSKVKLRIKGDGKTYQFRVKQSSQDYASYIYEFETSSDWMTIEIPFEVMNPAFRGQRLRMPNFKGEQMEEIGFLIGNKKEQSFELLIDKIELE